MLKDITIGQYYPGESVIHRLDPRVKIISTFAFMVSLFVIDSFVPYALIVLFLSSVVTLSKIPTSYILKGLRPLVPILLLTLVINMFLTPGDVIWSAGPLKLTDEGLRQGVFMVVRLIFLIHQY